MQLEVLAVSKNSLTGAVGPRLGQMPWLSELYDYKNWLTGTVTSDVGMGIIGSFSVLDPYF